MRISDIDNVGKKSAKALAEAGFRTAEGVAYAPIFQVTDVEGIDASTFENAQRMVCSQSNLSAEYTLKNRNYWCGSCDINEGHGDSSFNNETTCQTHMANCSESTGYVDV